MTVPYVFLGQRPLRCSVGRKSFRLTAEGILFVVLQRLFVTWCENAGRYAHSFTRLFRQQYPRHCCRPEWCALRTFWCLRLSFAPLYLPTVLACSFFFKVQGVLTCLDRLQATETLVSVANDRADECNELLRSHAKGHGSVPSSSGAS